MTWHHNVVFVCSRVVVFCGLYDVNGGGDRQWLLVMGGAGCHGWWWLEGIHCLLLIMPKSNVSVC